MIKIQNNSILLNKMNEKTPNMDFIKHYSKFQYKTDYIQHYNNALYFMRSHIHFYK